MDASRSERRREAILQAALELFLQHGYAETSVDQIVARAGGSKTSVYAYFGNKEGLFRALVESVPQSVTLQDSPEAFQGATVRDTLRAYGLALTERLVGRESMRLLGLAVTESGRFPKLGRLFYELGPGRTRQRLADYFAAETKAGRLHVPDPLRAAELFQGMLLYWPRLLLFLGVIKRPTRAELEGPVHEAVEMFLAAYGTGSRAARR